MYQDFFVKSPLLALPMAALVIFVVAFVVIVARAIRLGPTPGISAARLPLDDSEEVRRV